jgi:signal transduction histidine kinase
LRPWELETANAGGLAETLRQQIARFADRTGLSIQFDSDEFCGRLRPATAYGLTRIVQEALTNAAKHASAANIAVVLKCPSRDMVVCTIADDGAGLPADAEPSGFGLQAMQDRAQALGGTFDIASSTGAGTRITVSLPM